MIDRRHLLAAFAALGAAPVQAKGRRTPVIFYSDIGGDVDDTFALLQLLRRPELDLKLVVTESGSATYRARLTAKLLTLAGRSDVAIVTGRGLGDGKGAQYAWLDGFTLETYPGPVAFEKGARAIIDTVAASPYPVTIIALGPCTVLAEALAMSPGLAHKARFVGMQGSVRLGYNGAAPPDAEYNVKQDPAALRTVFAAPWKSIAITPLDTCGRVVLDGADLAKLRASHDPFAKAVVSNSEVWLPNAPWMAKGFDLTKQTSVLFDTVAVAMAYDESDLVMETLKLSVTDDGMTVIDQAHGQSVRVATGWKDLARFKRKLVADLTRKG